MARRFFIFLMVNGLLVLSYFSPWITENYARQTAMNGFNHAWKDTSDGCGSNKVLQSTSVPFGKSVEIDYACGQLPYDSPEFHHKTEVFVSFLDTVHIDKAVRPR